MSHLIRLSFALLLFCLLAATSATAQSTLTTTATDRRSVNVTIYNSNVGLVRETRMLRFPSGALPLRFAESPRRFVLRQFTWHRSRQPIH